MSANAIVQSCAFLAASNFADDQVVGKGMDKTMETTVLFCLWRLGRKEQSIGILMRNH